MGFFWGLYLALRFMFQGFRFYEVFFWFFFGDVVVSLFVFNSKREKRSKINKVRKNKKLKGLFNKRVEIKIVKIDSFGKKIKSFIGWGYKRLSEVFFLNWK